MSAPDHAAPWRDRARAARGVDNAPVADWCDTIGDAYDDVCEWVHSPEFEDRLRASIARLERRDV